MTLASQDDAAADGVRWVSRNVSVVVPVYNEVDNVRPLYEGICSALESWGEAFELLFVDDGSDDGTRERLQAVAERDDRVRVIRLRRNYGQTAAMRAGIEHARGLIVVTMDGDLQNDPRDIPVLVARIGEGYDFVTGWRRDRKDPALSRNLPSKVANWLIARVTGLPIHDTGCSLKAYRAELIRQVPLYSDMHRFIPAMCTMASRRFAEVVVRHHARRHGKSKYGLSRIGRVLLDVLTVKMLISSARRPLHWFGLASTLFFVLSMAAAAFSLYLAVTAGARWTIVFPVLAFLLGFLAIHLLLAGLFGELVIHTEPAQQIHPLTRCLDIHTQNSKQVANHEQSS